MKRLLSVCVVAAATFAFCVAPAAAQTLTANLNAGEETPSFLTGAVGTVEVSVDQKNEELAVALTVYNLPAGTTAGHIHIAPKGIAGPVVINFPIPTGRTDDLRLTFRVNGKDFVARPEIGINTMTDAIQAILLGNAYVNVHTTAHPAGEIRGQLALVDGN
jgi:CHRD domain